MSGAETAIIITGIVGTSVAAYGQYQSNKQAQSQAKAQSAWNMYNAKVSQREKEAQDAANLFESRQQKKKAEALLSKQRALIGASGVEMEGSPLLVAEDTAAELALEAENLRLTGQRKSQAYASQSILDISKASAAKSAAAGYGKAAVIGAGSSILQGGAQAGYMGYMMNSSSGSGGGASIIEQKATLRKY